ncbi:dipeptidase PepV [Metabacillus idriensis]|uniref:dipeptidase PepV n=1 Tax=Metabacillus idriensis TaxID=324768 RepID=UPI00174DBAE2|nr:dipeptidase PepV [Metabacillus idriensis]
MNWMEEVLKRKDDFIKDTQEFLRIKSLLDETTSKEGAPFGEGINEALTHMLAKGENDGFTSKNLEGYAGHLEMGQGNEIVGILCHVDVVPEGDGWSSDPYGAEIRDGKIFARGAIDDKGPTMAAYYAMKIVKELGLPLNKRVRMILGTDEESDWRCVDHYFKHEEMPGMGFAPDADFPIINAEKGIIDAKLSFSFNKIGSNKGTKLLSFQSGRRFNMVPDHAEAVIQSDVAHTFAEKYNRYINQYDIKGSASEENGVLTLKTEGVSAHGSLPHTGKNAGLLLALFLGDEELDENGKSFIGQVVAFFSNDTSGEKLGIQYEDEVSGKLTVNLGIISYTSEESGELGVNIRYPVTGDVERISEGLKSISEFQLTSLSDSKPHYVDAEHALIQTLKKVYEEQTGERSELIAIGGGTYARSLKAGVAFGPMFPGRPDVAHQKDEYVIIDDLLKATAIYAQAIYELAK